MRVRHKVTCIITEDTEGKDKLLSPDDVNAEIILDGPEEANVGRVALAAAAVFTVPFGSVGTGQGLFVKSSGDFDLVLNGGSALQIRRGVSAASGGAKASATKFFFEGTVTSAVITAVDALALTHAIWGDSAA